MKESLISENYESIKRFAARLDPQSLQFDPHVLGILKEGIDLLLRNREEYDQLSNFTYAANGDGFLRVLREDHPDEDDLNLALVFVGAVVREACLRKQVRSGGEQRILDYFLGTESGGQWHGFYLDYVRNVLPFRLLEDQRSKLGQAEADVSHAVEAAFSRAEDLGQKIEGYRQILEQHESDFSFVGLSVAFSRLANEKKRQAKYAFASCVLLGTLALVLPVLVFFVDSMSPFTHFSSGGWSPLAVAKLLGSVGIEVLLLYYFRVALRQHLTARSQLANLELRVALCACIEGYVKFAKDASKSGAEDAVRSFESIVFSALPADVQVPTTIEGLEQVARIVKATRP